MKIVLIMLSFAMKYLFLSIHFKSTRSKPVLKVRGEGRFRPHQHRQMFFGNLSTPEANFLVCQNVQFEDAIFYNYCVWNSLWISVWNAKKLA